MHSHQHRPSSSVPTSSRLPILVMTLVLWLAGSVVFHAILTADGSMRFLEAFSFVLFSMLFGWICFSFSLATAGFVKQVIHRLDSRAHQTPDFGQDGDLGSKTRTAILVPVYNESPTRVFAAIAAMREQLQQKLAPENTDCSAGKFDFFVLSDTTDPDTWLEEEWCWSELSQSTGYRNAEADPESDEIGIFYRHRTENRSRKAGNIADFCENWGSHYEFMIVLDADSLMTADTMIEMTRRMKADDRLGILQVPPVPIGRKSLFARMQQFSAAVYGPTFAEGFDRFAGDQGNYWGHNAILRVAPFMRHCHLPLLKGPAPLGGEILSHDFVEAALMVRAGYKVRLANDLGGSFEECPTTVLDFIKRDNRWCQGNLQHWQVMLAGRIDPISRTHFLSGILSYVAAPLWLAFMAACLLAAIDNQHQDAWLFAGDVTGLSLGLFIGSMALLLLPKVFAVVSTLLNQPLRDRLGGGWRIVFSGLVETVLSTLLAPLIAVYHTRFVISVLAGRSVKWNAQQRDETGVSWSEAFAQSGTITLAGLTLTVALAAWQPMWLVWFTPFIAGWLLAIPVTVALGSRSAGLTLERMGLLQITPERHPEPILSRHQVWISHIEALRRREKQASFFDRLLTDATFRRRHIEILRAAANQSPVQEHEPEWVERCKPIEAISGVDPTARRRLLSDDGWLESVPS